MKFRKFVICSDLSVARGFHEYHYVGRVGLRIQMEFSYPDGAFLNPDGAFLDPDRAILDPHGALLDLNGAFLYPDGTFLDPD